MLSSLGGGGGGGAATGAATGAGAGAGTAARGPTRDCVGIALTAATTGRRSPTRYSGTATGGISPLCGPPLRMVRSQKSLYHALACVLGVPTKSHGHAAKK